MKYLDGKPNLLAPHVEPVTSAPIRFRDFTEISTYESFSARVIAEINRFGTGVWGGTILRIRSKVWGRYALSGVLASKGRTPDLKKTSVLVTHDTKRRYAGLISGY
jgi:hypothetical protein